MLLKPYHLVAPLVLLLMAAGSSGGSDDGRQFALNGFAGANLTLGGASTVMPNGLLMLNNGATRKMKGHAFHPSPLPFGAGSNGTGPVRSFSTTFVFAIFGHGQHADLSVRGLVFFVSASWEVLSTALAGQSLGLNNGNQSASIFAVEFDTIYNAEFRDINRYVGVDGDSLVSLSSANTGYYDDDTGRLLNLSVISWKAIQVWVDYDSRAKIFTMTMAPLGMVRPKRPMLQTTIDLSGVVQSMAYVGFSSAMHNITSGHFILGWSFALDGPAPVLDISVLPTLPSAWTKNNQSISQPSMSMSLKLGLALASVTLVLVGIGIYISSRRRLNCSEVQEDWEVSLGPSRFSYKDLFHATGRFRKCI